MKYKHLNVGLYTLTLRNSVLERLKIIWINRGARQEPTHYDELASKTEEASKNRINIHTSDCDETQHLDTGSSCSLYKPQEPGILFSEAEVDRK